MTRARAYAVVFSTGAVVLALEILAGRYLVPAFGNSLFIWAAVLAVTLLALAVGYRWGGRLADRVEDPDARLCRHLLLTSIWVGALPLWGGRLLLAGVAAGPVAGPLVAGVLLFATPMVLLATAVPLAFGGRLRDRPDRPGDTLGTLFAVSTAGSVAGALAAGYFAVPLVGIGRTYFLLAVWLLALVLPALLRGRQTGTALVLLALLVASYAVPGDWRGSGGLKPGVRFLHRTATRYSQLDVLEDERDGTRVLLLDGASQNWVGGETWSESRLEYIPEILRLFGPRQAAGERALVLGLGAGTLVRGLADLGFAVDAVEIDHHVLEAARRYFGFPEAAATVHLEDARGFLRRAAGEGTGYRLIVVDVTSGGQHPEHVYDLEAYRLMAELLEPRGLLVLNMVLFTRPPHDQLASHTTATMRRVFPHVAALDLYPGAARQGELSQLLVLASPRQPLDSFAPHVERLADPLEALPALTDDWNPAPVWSIRANADWHRNIRGWLGEAVLVPS